MTKTIPTKIQACPASKGTLLQLQSSRDPSGNAIPVTDRTFTLVAYTGSRMRPRYWGDDVVVDLAGIRVPEGQVVPVILDHAAYPDYVIGSTSKITIADGQFSASGRVTAVGEPALQAIELADAGHQLQCSLGLDELAATYVDAGASATVNGVEHAGPVVVVQASTLREISVTVIGADGKTSFAIDAKANIKAGSGALPLQAIPSITVPRSPTVAEPKPTDTLEAARQAAVAEAHRINTINSLHASYAGKPGADRDKINTLQAKAIGDGWDVQRAELEFLKAGRNDTAPGRVLQASATDARALEAALAIRAGVRPEMLEKEYGQEILNRAAEKQVRASATFSGLANAVLAAAGQPFFAGAMTDESIRATFEADRMLRASSSGVATISLTGILSNVANKSLMASFFAVDDRPLQVFGRDSARDFKQVTRYRMTSVGDFEEVAKDGAIKVGTATEETFNNQVKTYARKIGISRQDLINDDLGAFTQIGQHLGRKAKIRMHKLGFGVLAGNANNFFHSNNKNLATGAGSVLSIAGLTAAAQLFLEQKDTAGDPVMVMPKYLLVAPANDVVAKQLYTDVTVNETTTADKAKPNSNPHRGAYTPLTSPFLMTGGVTGAANAKWWLLADPADVPCVVLIFLNGNEAPVIESSDLNFDLLGIDFRGYLDVGAAQADPKGGVQSNGS